MRNLIFISLLFVSALSFSQLKPGIVASSGGVVAVDCESGYLSNGCFNDASDWTFTAPWSFSSNSALYTDGVGSMALTQDSIDMATPLDSLTNYRLEFDITSTGSAGLSFSSENGDTYVGPALYADGSHFIFWKSNDEWQGGGLSIYASATTTTANFNLDNLALTERTLGSEMVTNGTFDTDTDWIKGSNWTISGGTANYTDGSSNDLEQTDATMVTSIATETYYRISFEISGSPTLAYFVIESTSGQEYIGAGLGYVDGTYIIDFTTSSDIGDGGITLDTSSGGTDGDFSIDNLSMKKWDTD